MRVDVDFGMADKGSVVGGGRSDHCSFAKLSPSSVRKEFQLRDMVTVSRDVAVRAVRGVRNLRL